MYVRRSRPRLACVLGLCAMLVLVAGAAPVHAQRRPNVTSDSYVVNQTFGGQSFFKDNNVWVYTPRFAETFGMPPADVDPGLQGIEAAAFRVEDTSYGLCGMGGKPENCKEHYRCITDIYVDERQHPLPWSTAQQADWLADYNSLRWLRTPKEKGITPQVSPGVIPNRAVSSFTLRPFSDPETRKEANFFKNANGSENLVMVFGYKRNAIANLTLVTLSHRCSPLSERSSVTFSLESRELIYSPTLARFYEFKLPVGFESKIDARLQARIARDREYYKKLLNMK